MPSGCPWPVARTVGLVQPATAQDWTEPPALVLWTVKYKFAASATMPPSVPVAGDAKTFGSLAQPPRPRSP